MRHANRVSEIAAQCGDSAPQSLQSFWFSVLDYLQRLSQEKQTSITRDLHTRQRLDNYRSASTPPKSLINHPHAIHTQTLRITRNTVHLNRFRTSFHPSQVLFQARWDSSQHVLLIDKVCFSACSTSALRARYYSANASNHHRSLPCPCLALKQLTPLLVVPMSINVTNANTFLAYEADT